MCVPNCAISWQRKRPIICHISLYIYGVCYAYFFSSAGSYDSIHKSGRLANTPVMGGESASCQSPRGFDADGSGGYISSYSPVGCVQEAWTAVTSRPWVAGVGGSRPECARYDRAL